MRMPQDARRPLADVSKCQVDAAVARERMTGFLDRQYAMKAQTRSTAPDDHIAVHQANPRLLFGACHAAEKEHRRHAE